MEKNIYSINELVKMGYPEQMLRRLLHSDDFSSIGFRLRPRPNSKAYIHKDRLDKYLEHRMDDFNAILD